MSSNRSIRQFRVGILGDEIAQRLKLHFSIQQMRADDIVFGAGDNSRLPLACLLARPMMLVNGFYIEQGLDPSHKVSLARCLFSYGQGYIADRDFNLAGCLFQVRPNNDTMIKFASTLGGGCEEDSTLYRIDYD